MKKLTIDPVTRIEGAVRLELFLSDSGDAQAAYLQVPTLNGFEKYAEGRPAGELPRLAAAAGNGAAAAQHLAAAKALDAMYGVVPTAATAKVRELLLCAGTIESHITQFYAQGSPDFIVGPDAPVAQRNLIGVVARIGVEIGREIIKHRTYAQEIQALLGGSAGYPVCCVPGGIARALSPEERAQIETKAKSCVDFARFSLKAFEDLILRNKTYLDTMLSRELYYTKTYSLGMVDSQKRVNFYDGSLRVASPDGAEYALFAPGEYLNYIAEHVESWSYEKFAFLKAIGWKGLIESDAAGILRSGPLGRLNAADGMATPLAQAEYERMFDVLGGRPVHYTLASHWARLIEMLYAAERAEELIADPAITAPDIRAPLPGNPSEGVGIVEAPRGTLIHHYTADAAGLVTSANTIGPSSFNHAVMVLSAAKVAKALIKNGKATEGLLNMVEMACRAYA
jgi:F420-non-reducing hydrogenase large subunit